jgi:ATP-binding cassette, subfamily B, bacterial PglK
MTKFLSKFLYITQGKRKALLAILILILLVSALEVIGVGIVGPFIALATNPNSINRIPLFKTVYTGLHFRSQPDFLLSLGLAVVVIFYIKSYLGFYIQTKIFGFGFTLQAELSTKLMQAYLTAPYTFHLDRNSATAIQNITAETWKFANGVAMPLLTSISNALVSFALLLLLIKTNIMAMVIIAGILLICFTVFRYLKDKLSYWGQEGADAQTQIIRAINHGLGGIKEIRIIGCETYFIDRAKAQTDRYGRNLSLAVSFSSLPRYIIESFLITFLIGFTVLFISFGHQNNQDLTAVLGIFALASIRLLPAAGNLASAVNGIRANLHALDRLYFDFKELESLKTPNDSSRRSSSIGQINTTSPNNNFADRIILDKVTYSYPHASASSLSEVYLEIKKGESIALIGKSGSGKTTLVDVILGLLTPQGGDITVDGVSIYGDLRSWQNKIGYVPQSIFLIDDTLAKNIAFGVPDLLIDAERLVRAIQSAQLSELVARLPQGLETMVGERGVLLSGGQRQRVGIARALYHEREILVFDEATAALDNETESLVTESIASLSGSKTMIIIAHRLSTIKHCDRIYVLDRGTIVKSGSYQEIVLSK